MRIICGVTRYWKIDTTRKVKKIIQKYKRKWVKKYIVESKNDGFKFLHNSGKVICFRSLSRQHESYMYVCTYVLTCGLLKVMVADKSPGSAKVSADKSADCPFLQSGDVLDELIVRLSKNWPTNCVSTSGRSPGSAYYYCQILFHSFGDFLKKCCPFTQDYLTIF
jgi:hypothetical protein